MRENTWLDPVPEEDYSYPEGRWYAGTAWGMKSSRQGATVFNNENQREYLKPVWRWSDAIQNDFASRADWCFMSYDEANHPPSVELGHPKDLEAGPGETVRLSAGGSS